MCYGMCKYEREYSGECRGSIDWNREDAACREEDVDEEEVGEYEEEYA